MVPPTESWHDDDWQWEDWDDDYDDAETTATVPCPECGAQIYEDTPYCPVCHNYVTPPGHVWLGRPLWWVILGLLGIIATTMTLISFWP